MKILLKLSPIFLILLGLAGRSFHSYFFSEVPLKQVPQLVTSLRAKEFCSCYYVTKNSEEVCLGQVKHYFPHGKYKIYEDQKKVTFIFLDSKSSAYFRNDKIGCIHL